MKTAHLALFALLLLSACASPYGNTRITDQDIARASQRANERMASLLREPLTTFENEKPISCSSPNLEMAVSGIYTAESALDEKAQAAGSPPDVEMTKPELGAIFEAADTATRHRCFNTAEKLYKHVLERYIGWAYTAYRERAKVGLDDVREARSKQPALKSNRMEKSK